MRAKLLIIAMSAALTGCTINSLGELQTVQWLESEGFDPGTARVLANDKTALRQYLLQRGMADHDHGYCTSLGASPGTTAYVQCRATLASGRQVSQPRQKTSLDCTSNLTFDNSIRTICD